MSDPVNQFIEDHDGAIQKGVRGALRRCTRKTGPLDVCACFDDACQKARIRLSVKFMGGFFESRSPSGGRFDALVFTDARFTANDVYRQCERKFRGLPQTDLYSEDGEELHGRYSPELAEHDELEDRAYGIRVIGEVLGQFSKNEQAVLRHILGRLEDRKKEGGTLEIVISKQKKMEMQSEFGVTEKEIRTLLNRFLHACRRRLARGKADL
jgi:DNA-directed RNA polymerase specialized sigma24 family protein